MRVLVCTACDHHYASGGDGLTGAGLEHVLRDADGQITATHSTWRTVDLPDVAFNGGDPNHLAGSAWLRARVGGA